MQELYLLFASLAYFRYFWRQHRTPFHEFRHLVLPWLSTIVLMGVLVGTVYLAAPFPLNLAPLVVLVCPYYWERTCCGFCTFENPKPWVEPNNGWLRVKPKSIREFNGVGL